MKKIEFIILHCSDSDNPKHDNIETIREWHLDRGWNDVGYHYFINKMGIIQRGRDEDVDGAHCLGFNDCSIGICLSGRKFFKDAQFDSAAKLIVNLMHKYELDYHQVLGHNYFTTKKTCPNFKIESIWERLSV